MQAKLSDTIERKFIDTIDVDDYEILTDSGFKDIKAINKTIEYEVWELKTEHHEIKCADNHIVFKKDYSETFVKNLKPNDLILIENGIEKVISVKSLGFKDNMYDISVNDDNHRYYTNGILSHNSLAYSAFCLWKLCFYPSTSIMLLAQEAKTSIELLGKIRMAYEYLPSFLKPGVITYNKSSIEFSNLSSMKAFATASQGARGYTCSILIVDEVAAINPLITDAFMSSVYPVVSRDPNSKVFFISTARDASDKNLFYHTWRIAGESDPNDINAWQRFRMDWWDVPGRDEKWKENQLKSIGFEKFAQEFGNEFGHSNSIRLFSSQIISSLRQSRKKSPEVEIKMDSLSGDKVWNIHCWERPKVGHVYVASSDIAEGIGGDSSVLLIFDVTDMSAIKLALSFSNANISISEFAALSARLLSCYNCPLFLAEDNGVGAGFLSILKEHYQYNDILNYDEVSPGIHSTQKTKMGACLWAKDFFDLYNVILADENLLNQMEVFSRNSSKSAPSYSAIKGEHDDYTLALIWALYLLKLDVIERQKRFIVTGTKTTNLGVEIVSHIFDKEAMNNHFVPQFMKDTLKDELMNGTATEIAVPWWNSDENIVIQTNRNVVEPLPFYVVGMNDSGYDFDDEPELGTW